VVDLLGNLLKVQEAVLGDVDQSIEEDEGRPDATLPDGEMVFLILWQFAEIWI